MVREINIGIGWEPVNTPGYQHLILAGKTETIINYARPSLYNGTLTDFYVSINFAYSGATIFFNTYHITDYGSGKFIEKKSSSTAMTVPVVSNSTIIHLGSQSVSIAAGDYLGITVINSTARIFWLDSNSNPVYATTTVYNANGNPSSGYYPGIFTSSTYLFMHTAVGGTGIESGGNAPDACQDTGQFGMGDATFGNACTSRSSNLASSFHVCAIEKTVPAPTSGTVKSACVYIINGSGLTCNFQIWRGNSIVASSGNITVTTGLNTITGLNLPVLTGDFIGVDLNGTSPSLAADNGVGTYGNCVGQDWSFTISVGATYTPKYSGYGQITITDVDCTVNPYQVKANITTPWAVTEDAVVFYVGQTRQWDKTGANPAEHYKITCTYVSCLGGGKAAFTECWWRDSDTYYVKPTGNDSNYGTQWDRAFKTITKLASVVPDGGRGYIAFGTYNGETQISPVNKGALGIAYKPVTEGSTSGVGQVIIPF